MPCSAVEYILWFDSLYVRVSTMMVIWTVGHRLRSTPTNGHTFTALGLPWRSPIQVLPEVTGRPIFELNSSWHRLRSKHQSFTNATTQAEHKLGDVFVGLFTHSFNHQN